MAPESSFQRHRMYILNITDNTVTVPQYDEDPVPSTSKQPLTVALVSSSHCVRPLLCALSEQVLSLERNSVGPRHFRTASLLSRNHFTIVTTSLPQEFLLTLSVVGISFKSEVKGRDFYIWRHHRCSQIFQRETNMPPPVPKKLVEPLGPFLFPTLEDSSSLHKLRRQAWSPLFQDKT